MDATCQFPRCRQPGVVIYMNRDLCCEHWRQVANAEVGVELEVLKRIDLTRTAQGEVIELTGATLA